VRSPSPGTSPPGDPGAEKSPGPLPDASELLEALPEGLLVVRHDRIAEVNDAFCEMLGFSREDLIGVKRPFPFAPPEELDRIERIRERMGSTGGGSFEAPMVCKDGGRIETLSSVSFIGSPTSDDASIVILVRDISDRRRREERLVRLAARDELTGLPNKRSFLVTLAGEVARARRHRRPLALAVLDLDGFKRANDLGGHRIGDRVLAEVAGRLGALVRTGEHMARIGGDEFGWILPDTDGQGALAAVTRARAAIAGEDFRQVGKLSVSAGICEQREALEAKDLYTRADRALYEAKAAGGDTVRVA
jgi:diguanylate cyclase (GGDEF)-like protein/PAS domain S-box-containing protein